MRTKSKKLIQEVIVVSISSIRTVILNLVSISIAFEQ